MASSTARKNFRNAWSATLTRDGNYFTSGKSPYPIQEITRLSERASLAFILRHGLGVKAGPEGR